MRKIAATLIALLLVLSCAAVAAGGLAYFCFGLPVESRPLVLISSPRYGDQVAVGEMVSVQAVARDKTKVARVELWVDGALLTSQESNLPGGVSRLPLAADWRPSSAGTHTLIVRAFNSENGRAYSSVNVEAVEGADQDGDAVADVFDSCPDEAGSPSAAGCPDSDGDTVADGEDSCPDQAGLIDYDGCPMTDDQDLDGIADGQDECPDEPGTLATEGCPDADGDTIPDHGDACPQQPGALGATTGDGCPAPSATDRDGDGTLEPADLCPDEAGSPLAEGCPDGDGDAVRDSDDDCPAEPGPLGAHGCPVPGGGEDSDGDGVRDVDDGCPEVWGWPEYSGCPDTDHDGVPDPDDLRPEDAGPPEAGGAPETGATDTDGDGVSDDDDRCVSEQGLVEDDGCPPPGPGERAEEPLSSGLLELLFRTFGVLPAPVVKGEVDVEVEALSFEADEPYNNVYCYVGLAGGDMERYTLSRLGELRWDRPFEGQNSTTITADDQELLEMRMECGAYRNYLGPEEGWEGPPYDLGSILVGHPVDDWDGTVFEARSSNGTEGHSFYVKYRLCLNSCEGGGLPAPRLSVVDLGIGQHQLEWDWGGDPNELVGFKLYINGAFNGNSFNSDARSWVLPESFEPTCTETIEFELTAFSGNTFTPSQESPRSEALVLEGPPCPRTVRVTFERLDTYDLRDESRMDGDQGPIDGCFSANDASLCFNASDYPEGYTLSPWSSYNIRDIFDTIWTWKVNCTGPQCAPFYEAPDSNSVTVELGPDEELTVGGYLDDIDSHMYETFFSGWHSIEPGEILPGPLEIRDQQVQLTVQIDVLVGPEVGALPDLVISDVTSSEEGQLRIYVFNNAADLVSQDITVQVERLSTGEVLATPTWPNMTIPSGGEVRLEQPGLLLEPHDLRVIVNPDRTIEEMPNRNNVYETPVMMRVEFVQLRVPEWACEGFLNREAELWFWLSVGHGLSVDDAFMQRTRYPESGVYEMDTGPLEDRPFPPMSLEGQERYSMALEMPADENLYIWMAGYEQDGSRDDSMGRIEVEYGPDVNYGHSDQVYTVLSSGEGTEECDALEPLGPEYFGFEAQWRITRVY
jgi:hypothetical protein